MKISTSGCSLWTRSMPSGAAIRQTREIRFPPRFLMRLIAAAEEPPVASMGSRTKISRSSMSKGSLQ